jgi:hypothetical protein
LKNELVKVDARPLLPFDARKISRIAVVGRLANVPNTGDRGSSQVFSPHVVTPIEGLRAALPQVEVILEETDSVERARELSEKVDLVICVVGYDATDEGEYVVPSLQSDICLLDLFPPAETVEEKSTLDIVKGDTSGDKLNSALEVGAGGDRRSLRLRSQDTELIAAVTAADHIRLCP